jgi:hypothetical protein
MSEEGKIQEAPIHKKLRAHREKPTLEGLRALLEDHHSKFPPAFVWAPNLLLVLEEMQNEINELREALEAQK